MSGRRINNEGSIYEYPAGSGKWHVRFTMGKDERGKTIRLHRNARNRTEATKIINELKRQRDSGTWDSKSSMISVAELLDDWLNNVASRRSKRTTLDTNRGYIKNRIKPVLGDILVDRLTTRHLDTAYANWMTDEAHPLSPSTVRKLHAIISAAFSSALKRGLLTKDVTKLVTPPEPSHFHEEPLSVTEIRAILKVASAKPMYARWLLALHYGLRQGECLGLRWSDIDFDGSYLVVRSTLARAKWQHGCTTSCGLAPHKCPMRKGGGAFTTTPKSGKPRIIVLTPAVTQALKAQFESQQVYRDLAGHDWQDDEFVFTSDKGRPLDQKFDYKAWHGLLMEAGVRRTRLHNARHSSGTLMGTLGVPLRDIQEIFGHSSPKVTERYVHVLPAGLQRAADLVSNALGDAGVKPNEDLDTKTETDAPSDPAIRDINKDIPSQNWSRLGDLNPGPTHYECVALPLS